MRARRQLGTALLAGVMSAAPAVAQQQALPPGPLPFQVQGQGSNITTPQGRAASQDMLTTKPANEGAALPWNAPPVPVTPPGMQATPQPIPQANPYANTPSPFGRPSSYQPVAPGGPAGVMAVPVENVEMIEASEPAPAVPQPLAADPVNEDPAAPTELTAPIFKAEETAIPLSAEVSVLNKVTARKQLLTIKPGAKESSGKLTVTARHCQRSAENSLPDAAVFMEITEELPEEKEPKLVFSGWMYQSSPSVSALEHPVYDVTLMGCRDTAAKPKESKDSKKK